MGNEQRKLAACIKKIKPSRAVYPGKDCMEKINAEVIKRMEAFATEALKLFPDQREECFKQMVRDGVVTQAEAEWLEEYVCLYRLMTDGRYYKAVQKTVGEMLLSTFKG